MSTATTSYPSYSPVQTGLLSNDQIAIECACKEEAHEQNNFFRGIFVAVPTGLAMWFCLLKLASVIVHHI